MKKSIKFLIVGSVLLVISFYIHYPSTLALIFIGGYLIGKSLSLFDEGN